MEPHHAPTISLVKKDVVLVKPANPAPADVLSLSTIDSDINLEILCQTLYVYRASETFSNGKTHDDHDPKPVLDPASIVKEALSRALVYYYPLAGKLKRQSDGKLVITCTASDGVPFLEATANCHLSSLNFFDDIEIKVAEMFVFDWPTTDDKQGYHPLVLQVTQFACGGFTIGMGLSHSVCDGFGAAQFFRALTELASGKTQPKVNPVWNRERLVGKVRKEPIFDHLFDKSSLATSPFLPTNEISHASFVVDSKSIRNLKMQLMKEREIVASSTEAASGENFTTLEVLSAYVWRSRLRALKQNPDGKTIFGLAVGIRNLINPPLPPGYYGNAFVAANVALLGKELDEKGSLSKVAMLIKESKKLAAKNEHIRNSLDILETLNQKNVKMFGTTGSAFVLTDWRQLGLLEEIDFGWGSSVNMIPLPWNMFGYIDLCIFMPPSKVTAASANGGVRILVALPKAAMPEFQKEMDALTTLEVEDNTTIISANS